MVGNDKTTDGEGCKICGYMFACVWLRFFPDEAVLSENNVMGLEKQKRQQRNEGTLR